MEFYILDSSDNIQEDEVSNFDDRVIDKNFSKVTAEQEKPKPTRKKTVKKSTSTPLKRLTKRRSTKPSLANPNKRNGKPTNSDLELSVLNQKIGNIEIILERLDLKVAEVNASYIESKTELIKTVDDSLNRFMKDTINRIELLESRNKELEEKINNIGSCDNIVNLNCDNEIRITVEDVFKKNIDSFIKDSHEIITASLNEVVDKEFQSIQSEKRELMSLFEDFKVRNNKEFDAQKLQMDQIVQEIDALKRSDFDCETNIKTDNDIKSTDEKIRITAEKVFNNNIDSYVKVSQQRIIEKLNEVVEKKIQTIQPEKIELVSLFEDFKVRQKNDWTTQKLLMDEVVQELHSGVSKSIEEIDILKKANMSKSDKIKKCEETLKEMSTKVESKHSQQFSVNQIEEKVETLFFDLIKKQSVSNRINQNSLVDQDDSTAGYSEFAQDKVGPKYKERNLPRTRVKCDIVILMDSNRRFISKKG